MTPQKNCHCEEATKQSRREARSQELARPSAAIAFNSRSALEPLRSVVVLYPAAGSRRCSCLAQTLLKSSSLPTIAGDALICVSKLQRRGRQALSGWPSAKIPNGPTPSPRARSKRRITGDDCHLYFQKKIADFRRQHRIRRRVALSARPTRPPRHNCRQRRDAAGTL